MDIWGSIAGAIGRVTGSGFSILEKRSVSGGCINQAYQISSGDKSYFVKLNHSSKADMFSAEVNGLEALIKSNSVRVPKPLISGVCGDSSFLVMEYIVMDGGDSAAKLGEQLAFMHRSTASTFGWTMDNTIGSTAQVNSQHEHWLDFWRDQRLGFQLKLAREKGVGEKFISSSEALTEVIGCLFESYNPVPSLLHGDLWGGNYSTCSDGEPVIYDPAVYYGDREADIAMTELFGGFGSEFYAAYNATWPLDAGYSVRKDLYNLYHIINHYNLFGGGYASQASAMMKSLVAQTH